jgi:hypothetical protein
MNDDGTVMRGDAVKAFAEKHRLARITIVIYRLSAGARQAGPAHRRISGSEDRHLAGLCHVTFDAIQHMAFVMAALATARRAGTAASRRRRARHFCGGNPVHAPLQHFEGRARRDRILPMARRAPTHAIPTDGGTNSKKRARGNGAKSG